MANLVDGRKKACIGGIFLFLFLTLVMSKSDLEMVGHLLFLVPLLLRSYDVLCMLLLRFLDFMVNLFSRMGVGVLGVDYCLYVWTITVSIIWSIWNDCSSRIFEGSHRPFKSGFFFLLVYFWGFRDPRSTVPFLLFPDFMDMLSS